MGIIVIHNFSHLSTLTEFLRFVGAFTSALTLAFVAAFVLRRKLVRHRDDGKLAIHCWDTETPWQYFDCWTELATKQSPEAAFKAHVLGHSVEVWFLDPEATGRAVLDGLMARP